MLPGKTTISSVAADREAGLLTAATIGRGIPNPVYLAQAGEFRPLTIRSGITLPVLSKYGEGVGSYVQLANLVRDELDTNPPERDGAIVRSLHLYSQGADRHSRTFSIGGSLDSDGCACETEGKLFAVSVQVSRLNWCQIHGRSEYLFSQHMNFVTSHQPLYCCGNSLLILGEGDQVDFYLDGLSTYKSSFRYSTGNIYPSFQRWKLWVIGGKLTFAPHRYWYEHKQEQLEAERFQQIADSERKEVL